MYPNTSWICLSVIGGGSEKNDMGLVRKALVRRYHELATH